MVRHFVWVDIETTGLDFTKEEIHEFAVKCGFLEKVFYVSFTRKPTHNLPIAKQVIRVTMETAIKHLDEFLEIIQKRFDPNKNGLVFAGQNPTFDLSFLNRYPSFVKVFKKYFHYGPFDLASSAHYVRTLGKIPRDQSIKLMEMVEYFNLEIENGVPHQSLYDVRACDLVYKELINRY